MAIYFGYAKPSKVNAGGGAAGAIFKGTETFIGKDTDADRYFVFRNMVDGDVKQTVSMPSNQFKGITEIGDFALSNAFNSAIIDKITFPDLKRITDYGFYVAFEFANIDTIEFPQLETVDNYGLYYTFWGTSVKNILFPKLKTISNGGFTYAICYCYDLETISFPSLTNVDSLSYVFYNCSDLKEIHFRKDMEDTIKNLYGYDNGFGASNATIYFDLEGE